MSDNFRDVFRNEVIRASAGTGKTFALSNRFLRLLASGVECETILATTFTRKAAGEILDRIVQRLAKAALCESAAQELAEQLEWSIDQTRAQDLLRELIQNLHRLQISTLDAFFYRIAQSFRLELGLPTQWQIVNEQQIEILQNQIIREILHDKSVIDLLHLMTKGEAQRRIAALISSTVNRLYDVRVQSDKQAWNRLEPVKSYQPNREFDSIIEQLETIDYPNKHHSNQVNKEIELIRQEEWLELITKGVFSRIANGIPDYQRKPFTTECIQLYQEVIEHCRGYVVDMLIRKNSSTFDLLDKFGKRLESEKTVTGQLRFQDITNRIEEFIYGKETDDFSFRLDHKVNHLLLDEFQDTSIAQWNVIAPFAERTTAEDDRRSFFCVGDLKQAIFGWRGGVAEIFDSVECSLTNMSEAQPLVKSYRSSQIVIDFVNKIFGSLDQYDAKNEVVTQAVSQWSERFTPHETAKEELPGYFELEFANESDVNGRWEKNRVRNINALATTVHRIRTLHEQMPDRSIGVLVRKNETIGELIYQLRDAGIPASEEGGNPLTDSAAVEIILSLITLADHPGDGIARFQLSHSPLAEPLGLAPETKQNQKENLAAADAASESLRAELLVNGLGFTVEKYARMISPSCTPRELSRLQQLVQEAFNFGGSQDETRIQLRPLHFVNHIRNEFKASDESSAQVRVMTIHQSKGLEFDIVVLPMPYENNAWFSRQSDVIVGREDATSPINLVCRLANENVRNLLPVEFRDAFDETRRREVRDNLCVLYVAMTRAIHATHVVMSYGCKPDECSNASVLLATLHPGDRQEGTVFSHGDKDWYKTLTDSSEQNKVGTVASEPVTTAESTHKYYLPFDATLTEAKLAESNRLGRGMARTSPSRLEGGNTVIMSSIFSMVANEAQLSRGSLIHACFELVTWLDEQSPTRRQLKTHLQSFDMVTSESEIEATIDKFLTLVKQPQLTKLLSRQTYLQERASHQVESTSHVFDALRVEVHNERGFAVSIDDQLLQGFIDRLVLVYEGNRLLSAEIIDYKTDAVHAGNLQNRINHYRPQLTAYRKAVATFCNLPIENVSTQIAFVLSDQIIDIDATNSDANLPEDAEPTSGATSPTKPKSPKPKTDKPASGTADKENSQQMKKPKFKQTQQCKQGRLFE